MRHTLLTIFFISACTFSWSQTNPVKMTQKRGTDWMIPQENLTTAEFLSQYQSILELPSSNTLELEKVETDQLGFTHQKFNQHQNGIQIEGANYLVHAKNNQVTVVNGKIIKGITASSTPGITSNEAIVAALNNINAPGYYWEDPALEARLKHIKKDNNATFYPNPELVFADPVYGKAGTNYRLAWKMEINAKGPTGRQIVFVDAQTGNMLFQLEGCHTGAATGTAETRYHGTQTIVTDSISPTQFILHDDTRGGGIETYDMNQQDSIALAVDFVDTDNYWNNANAEFDEAATDAHWGMEMTYDYYFNQHGRDSYDNQGTVIQSYIHYNVNWFNARWTGFWAEFGDGLNNPLTSIDVVSHELTHGVTGNSAGLVYQNESGALNESFSDIFGTAVEFAALPATADWLIGLQNFTLRDMSDPNSYGDPDTYFGTNWYTGSNDNGGVHTNSGVQNFWFYLLSEGGIGTNDIGNAYNLDGLGMTDASRIAYRNLTVYLTSSSTYYDARLGAIQSAEDLFGPCSFEVIETAKAWHAVGIGQDTTTQDVALIEALAPLSTCQLGSNENLTVSLKYNRTGCGDVLNIGDSIPVGYRLNAGPAMQDTIVLTATLNGGDTLIHTFSSTEDFSTVGIYSIDFWSDFGMDGYDLNDTIFSYAVTRALSLNDNDVIAFEDLVTVNDSFFVQTESNSRAEITALAANTGSNGFRMTGYQADPGLTLPQTEADNFILNQEYTSAICMCVDASTWSNVRLGFDMKQTHSQFYLAFIGMDIPNFATAMRILVDGNQIGNQHHPITYSSDPYLNHTINLDQFAGTQFELCFQGHHFLRVEEDPIPGSKGDNTYLDNIFLVDDPFVGTEEHEMVSDVKIYPNPNNGNFNLYWEGTENESGLLTITNLLGEVIQQNTTITSNSFIPVDMNKAAPGIYLVALTTPTGRMVRRVIVE
jgi:Zn-dependent metalloprotease